MKNKIKILLSLFLAFIITSCFPRLGSRYHIPLMEGSFLSEELNEEISLVGLVTEASVELIEISEETFKEKENNVVKDYPGKTFYQVNFSLKTSELDIDFDMKYIGTNNNQPDSYRFESMYRLHKVIILLIVNENSETDSKVLEYFELRFHIYQVVGNYTFRTNLYLNN